MNHEVSEPSLATLRVDALRDRTDCDFLSPRIWTTTCEREATADAQGLRLMAFNPVAANFARWEIRRVRLHGAGR